MRFGTTFAALVVVLVAALSGCSNEAPTPAPEPKPTPPPTADPPPRGPKVGDCFRLAFDDAIAPTSEHRAIPCERGHTSETYAVGELDTVVEGHLLAVDSEQVQSQVAATCPEGLPAFLGGDPEDLRLTVVRPVWFTPTVEDSDLGASWFRCDVVVLAGNESLSQLDTTLADVLTTPAGRESVALCATAAPDARAFERVPCSAAHKWRAVQVVEFEARRYPGEAAARERGQTTCENAGLDAADDPREFGWGYEWPNQEQWDRGMDYGRCWVPD